MADSREILIWGIRAILEILHNAPEQVGEISIQQSGSAKKLQAIINLAEKHRIKIGSVAKITIPGEANPNHQGVLARIRGHQTVDLTELLKGQPSLLVALDSISDPHNLGAIIRSAAAAGAVGILIPKDRAAQITGTVVKVAAGALAHIKICRVTNLSDSLRTLKDSGYWIFGAAGEGQQTIYEADFSGPTCLVIGSEGKGIRKLVRKQCDFLVKIPMGKKINSLNASVAAGIILFEIARQKELQEMD
ncbi:MAG: 23S rRNA (guanosine(2251)-2'-O)-methyltransferase RlmB [Desulfobulbaceae bacterium]|nr:23S rRNA (guanosine(2251)-2'-O)-methyltransferase RlmB [Desulfobulbaceae bacterium]